MAVVSNVLQGQATLKAWRLKCTDAQSRDRQEQGPDVLASHYQKLALPSQRFAQLLAQGDAQVAAYVNDPSGAVSLVRVVSGEPSGMASAAPVPLQPRAVRAIEC